MQSMMEIADLNTKGNVTPKPKRETSIIFKKLLNCYSFDLIKILWRFCFCSLCLHGILNFAPWVFTEKAY